MRDSELWSEGDFYFDIQIGLGADSTIMMYGQILVLMKFEGWDVLYWLGKKYLQSIFCTQTISRFEGETKKQKEPDIKWKYIVLKQTSIWCQTPYKWMFFL
jgi:hypothetical protein